MSLRVTRFLTLTLVASRAVSSFSVAAETSDGKIYTQAPEIAPVAGRAVSDPGQPTAPPVTLFKDGPLPSWIWGADETKDYVVKTTFQGTGKSAWLRATCDNSMTIYVNGKKVATSSHDFTRPEQLDIKPYLNDGENVIEAEAVNSGGPAGFVAKLVITGNDGKMKYVVTDESWKVADRRDAKDWSAAKVARKLEDHPGGKAMLAEIETEIARDLFNVLPGFQVERLFTVPKNELGSWVCLTTDPKGRLIISDQGDKGLVRVTPTPLGSNEPTRVERLDVQFEGKLMTGAQGLLVCL